MTRRVQLIRADSTERLVVVLALAASAAAASVVAALGASVSGTIGWRYVVLCVAALGAAALSAYRPIAATYIYLALLPFLAGIDRGNLLPLVRPNEALLVLLLVGALVGGYVRFLQGEPIPFRLERLDASLAAFLVLATLWPITSMLLRGAQPGTADLAALLPICKQMAVLLLVRATVVSDTQIRRCIQLVVLTASVVALIAVLQTLRFGPVVDLMDAFWDASTMSFEEDLRGSTTLAHPIATGDYIIIGWILLGVGWLKGLFRSRFWLIPGAVLAVGILAAGQFSSWLAAGIAGVLLLWRFPEARRHAVRLVPLAPIAAVVGAPAVLGRLADFQSGELPISWQVRWDNVVHFYLPELTGLGALLGVSPNSVLEPPETWRDTIYLEAGYIQFLWIGGLPLLLAFLWLSREIFRQAGRGRNSPDAYGVCCACLEVIWWIVLVLTMLDPHLFLRGVGDLLFTLIAISTRRGHEREHSRAVPA